MDSYLSMATMLTLDGDRRREILEAALNGTLKDAQLEPMTLRYVKDLGNGVAHFRQLVGSTAGKVDTNIYRGQNTWEMVLPLLDVLEPLTQEFGDVLHMAVLKPNGTKLRMPIALVETMSLDDAKAAEFSVNNHRNSRKRLGHGDDVVFAPDPVGYAQYCLARNDIWLTKIGWAPPTDDVPKSFNLQVTHVPDKQEGDSVLNAHWRITYVKGGVKRTHVVDSVDWLQSIIKGLVS